MNKLKIKEIIVVEGKDDISAVKSAVDCEVLDTNGLGLDKEKLNIIIEASKKQGIIILTDPDYPGEKIRNIVSSKAENVKHAFIEKEKTIKDGDLGIENASKEDIIKAIIKAKPLVEDVEDAFTIKDMMYYGLIGMENSSKKREELGNILNIGFCSAKKFLKRINSFKIDKKILEKALIDIERRYENE
ncbi:MAG: ribonuclease M5 [Bacillota bacterium]|nr:ribonuclease M5 [Bacillota bacterium]